MTMKPGGQGTAVLISDAPEGQVPHYVMRAWGTDYGGAPLRSAEVPGFIPLLMKKLIVLDPYPDRTGLDLICHDDDALFVKTWAGVSRNTGRGFSPGCTRSP